GGAVDWTTGGGELSTGNTQPPGVCAAAATVAAPHRAAAVAPPLIAVSATQGSICVAGAAMGVALEAATAVVELRTIELAITTPIKPLVREPAIMHLLALREFAPAKS